MAEITREAVLREIPRYNRKGESLIRPDFRDLRRVVVSQTMGPGDLEFIYREVVARKKRLGFDDEGA